MFVINSCISVYLNLNFILFIFSLLPVSDLDQRLLLNKEYELDYALYQHGTSNLIITIRSEIQVISIEKNNRFYNNKTEQMIAFEEVQVILSYLYFCSKQNQFVNCSHKMVVPDSQLKCLSFLPQFQNVVRSQYLLFT